MRPGAESDRTRVCHRPVRAILATFHSRIEACARGGDDVIESINGEMGECFSRVVSDDFMLTGQIERVRVIDLSAIDLLK